MENNYKDGFVTLPLEEYNRLYEKSKIIDNICDFQIRKNWSDEADKCIEISDDAEGLLKSILKEAVIKSDNPVLEPFKAIADADANEKIFDFSISCSTRYYKFVEEEPEESEEE